MSDNENDRTRVGPSGESAEAGTEEYPTANAGVKRAAPQAETGNAASVHTLGEGSGSAHE